MRYQSVQPIWIKGFETTQLYITTIPCPGCGKTTTLVVDEKALDAAVGGTLIQKAFPDMSSDDRERLISGYCATCWDILFGDD